MHKAVLQERLAKAQRHIAVSQTTIERQWTVIERLEADGRIAMAASARDILKILLQSQKLYERDRDRLMAELAR